MITLLGELPGLGALCPRRIAFLAELLSRARESGSRRVARRIRGGGRKVRETRYIAACHIPTLTAMRGKGKSTKTILNRRRQPTSRHPQRHDP